MRYGAAWPAACVVPLYACLSASHLQLGWCSPQQINVCLCLCDDLGAELADALDIWAETTGLLFQAECQAEAEAEAGGGGQQGDDGSDGGDGSDEEVLGQTSRWVPRKGLLY